MKHYFKNTIGQIVGEYDDATKVYWTIRNQRKGEIFIKKHWFGGVYFHTATAIDTPILNKLIQVGCKRIDILISGLKSHSFIVSFNPEEIVRYGKPINYDKSKMAIWGNQIAFDIHRGIFGGNKQEVLNNEKYSLK